MGFPIKKRINCTNNNGTAPCGLDLLSAAIDSRPQHGKLSTRSSPEGMVISSHSMLSADEFSGSDNDESLSAPSSPKQKSEPSSRAAKSFNKIAGNKRAKTFPDILLEILSNPSYVSIVSWLPNGKSFAIHDANKFSSEILPKYFRRVIFRSFVRKLNRWGFRSVKRSISGFETTFEHTSFCRDQPELVADMQCKSNPASKAAILAVAETNSTSNITSHGSKSAISPSVSISHMASSIAYVAQVPQVSPLMNGSRTISPCIEEFPAHLRNQLILQEIHHRREKALMQLAHRMNMTDADLVSQFFAEKLRRSMMQQQRGMYNMLGL